MIITTTEKAEGYEIESTLGLVQGNTVRARHIGRDIFAGIKNLVGGEISEYTKLQMQAREQATQRMIDHARNLGADAIVCARFSTALIMNGCAEIVAYGTAVKLKK